MTTTPRLGLPGQKKKAAVTKALEKFIAPRRQMRLRELVGQLEWDDSFGYEKESALVSLFVDTGVRTRRRIPGVAFLRSSIRSSACSTSADRFARFSTSVPSSYSWAACSCLVAPAAHFRRPIVRAFVDWALEEAQLEVHP